MRLWVANSVELWECKGEGDNHEELDEAVEYCRDHDLRFFIEWEA